MTDILEKEARYYEKQGTDVGRDNARIRREQLEQKRREEKERRRGDVRRGAP